LALSLFYSAQCQYLYTKQGTENEIFVAAVEEIGQTNYLLGSLTWKNSKCTSKILRVSQNGNLIDSLVLDSNFVLFSILALEGNYFLNGSVYTYSGSAFVAAFPTIYKLDGNFNLVKKKILDSLPLAYAFHKKIIAIKKNLYSGYSTTNLTNLKFYKLNQNLNKLDSAVLTGDELYDMEGHGNNILISGVGFPQSFTNSPIQVGELDTTFNVLSRFNIDSLTSIPCQKITLSYPLANLSSLGNNKYLIAGSTNVNVNCLPFSILEHKLISGVVKNNQTLLQTHVTGMPGKNFWFHYKSLTTTKRYNSVFSVGIISDLNVSQSAIALNVPLNINTYLHVNKIDTSGALKWTNNYGGDRYYLPISAYATSDSGLVICGLRYDSATPKIKNIAEAFVMKIDKNGNQVFVGIQQNGKINTHYHKIYPNPSQNKIHFDIPLQTNIEIVIYDLLGKEEKRIEFYKNLSPLDISELKPGTHIYKIKTTTGVFSGKFIKE
jgi:hypothetical protein